MTTHPDELVELVTNSIAASTRYDSAPRDTARNILDALAQHRAERHLDDRLSAIVAVEAVLARHFAGGTRWAAAEVVDRLLGAPTVLATYDPDGRVASWSLSWPHESAAGCIVARTVLEQIIADANDVRDAARAQLARIGDLTAEVADLRARTAAVRDRQDLAEGRGLTLMVGEPGPELPSPFDGATGAPQAPQNGPGGPETPTEARQEPQAPAGVVGGPYSPDCLTRKHAPACSGDAWDATRDVLTDCRCSCHRAVIDR